MESIRDLLGCRCHALGGLPATSYTFPWAKEQYLETLPVHPTHQSLDLTVDMEREEIVGSSVIDFKTVLREVESFRLDAVDLKISAVQIRFRDSWKPVNFLLENHGILVSFPERLKRGETGSIKIDYVCRRPRAGLYFIKPDKHYPNRPTQLWSQGQDDDARYWFPCFDQPQIKCTYEMKVKVPAGFLATSNGALVSEARGDRSWSFHWKGLETLPSYLVTLTVGRFSEIKESWRGKPVTYLVEKGREAEAKRSFGKTPKMLEHFSEILGVEYPYEKYTQIAVAEFIFGGMENTTATTQTDSTLHPAEIEEDYSSDDLVSHELAHQWFGDLVTCKSWTHGWLNEGWATFMEGVFKEHDLGPEEAQYYRYEELQVYLAEDKNFRRPIVTNYYADPAEVWDRHTYQKAGLVLNLLRADLGDQDFWEGARLYLHTYRGGVVETVDFQRCMERASGKSLQSFFDQWIYKDGFPELKIEFSWDEKSKIGRIRAEQKQNLSETTPVFKISSQLNFVFPDKTVSNFELIMKEKDETFCIPLKERPLYCRIDAGNNLLKTLEWAMPEEMAVQQLKNDADPCGKIYAMKALVKEATGRGLEALTERLKTDSFWGVRAEAAGCLGEMKGESALEALLTGLREEKKSKVRSRICSALGGFRDDRSAQALARVLEEDPSTFVRGAAAAALGKTKSPDAMGHLKKAIKAKSWNDVVASQAFVGLKNLRDERVVPILLEGSVYGAPKMARLTAVAGLGELGLDKMEVTEFLENCLEDPFLRVRIAAAGALAQRKDPGATAALDQAAHQAVEGHFKAAAFRSAQKIRERLEKSAEFKELEESVSKISEENRKLRDRVSQLETLSK